MAASNWTTTRKAFVSMFVTRPMITSGSTKTAEIVDVIGLHGNGSLGNVPARGGAIGPMVTWLKRTLERFHRDERGAVLAEALIIVPFVTLFSVGILEFGNMFWEKEQIETGLRDAARYLARCQPSNAVSGYVSQCSDTVARRIAYYGTSNPAATALRVPGWGPSGSAIVFATVTRAGKTVNVASTSLAYSNSPLFGWLGLANITIQAYHEERYIGW
ncbi:TadE/TadG family type IV pilus assembly protein [Mesorhizobium sp. WSM3626]|uniref:TadE/TadG family type IV pilus assembly protein n=1 Tax=Mesorhizobium sp. WSM3626 TaxID=1040987 RepID=UPI001FD89600|nr:TadE/TadG family type IV pilus assembly protein [Mesorhizobium sp. WSM3626]